MSAQTSQTQTLSDSESPVISDPAEKQPIASSQAPPPSFPEGGLKGWLCLLGSFLAIFATFGYANAFGVFQAYYATCYPDQSPSNISWVGSIQLFLQFFLGAFVGPLYDKGYFRHLVIAGTVLYVVCLFMTSLCHEFWQTVMAQGLGVGLGIGLIYLPAISILSHYFHRRRTLALGIAFSGSSLGGVCLPIMLNNLIVSHGFSRAVQYTGYLIMGCLIVAFVCMQPRLPPKGKVPLPSIKSLFEDRIYVVVLVAQFLTIWGIFFPIYYLQVYAEAHGLSQNLTFYTLATINAASIIGRILPNFLTMYLGTFTILTGACSSAGVLCFSIFGADSPGGLIVVSILFGFFSGAYIALSSPIFIAFARGFEEIGARLGLGLFIISFAALSGTPINGVLLDRYGFYAPTIWSGVCVLSGAALFVVATLGMQKRKNTWKV